jgi:hypothetical protein
MTYQNQFDIDFEYNGSRYGATADVTVELSRQDVGPIGYRDHVERFATDSVTVENLSIGELPNGEDIIPIPEDLQNIAESKLMEIASERAEEFLADE